MKLTSAQNDRATGILLGLATGDALGARYEFQPPLPDEIAVGMFGGGQLGWEPGEWTDDTAMAIPIARAAAAGLDLRDEAVLDRIAATWADWAYDAKDVGIQIGAVIRRASSPTAAGLREAAVAYSARSHRSSGNGSLMRVAPVALAYLDDPDALVEAATALSQLTHTHPDAVEACVIWSLGIRHAVLHGTFDGVRAALGRLPADRAAVWAERLDEAERNPPTRFNHNGWVVEALQGAWSAITRTPVPELDPVIDQYPCGHFAAALEAAVRGGRDTDTVAAIAGGLLGARWGASAVPARWRRVMHGWPGERSGELVRLAALAVAGGRSDASGWPAAPVVDYSAHGDVSPLAAHPRDPGVWLGGVARFERLPDGIDAVVSLCRVGAPAAAIPPSDHIEVRLVDRDGDNPNLDFVLADAADAVAALRAEGKTVLLHCVQAISRTPAVGALYAVRHLGVPADEALAEIQRVLPHAHPIESFRAALLAAEGAGAGTPAVSEQSLVGEESLQRLS
ncbi:ADP-ribosylglycohydrolase family protein [Cryobacterium sp. Sr8]|uniref:ADP-ribosylglycohydrolase family protein n=1 Tax=Cryobacterium sp. Sr8 TaxID=1259203 RepID=UPI00106D9F0E|nr:ADP-ribosylglycohydrolase family protein [Cryobacterium sp. Sr8]TFD76093.1 ADP-ribosylglycohydrolase family protein [Cryobacterium sp. Sr8]